MPGARIVVEHLTRAYGKAVVLDDVSFVIEPGEMVALVGESGSGKTTLLQLIGSLDRPTSGQIHVDDISVGELEHPALYRRSTVGFVFQLHYLLGALSAQDNVELPLQAAGLSRRERNARALDLLEKVGLGDRPDARPSELSGGERQRVAIARAVAGRPRLILADEPTGSLDSASSEKIWELLSDVCTKGMATVLIATHDLGLAVRAGRELRLHDGRLISDDEPIASGGVAAHSDGRAETHPLPSSSAP